MAFWNRDKDYKPWDWDPDRDDPDKNGRNDEFRESEEDKLFEQNKSEFEWNELESKITPEFIANGLKKNDDRIKKQYEDFTTGPGQNLMILQLTGWTFGAKNELALSMMKLQHKIGLKDETLNENELGKLIDSNMMAGDGVNMSVMTAFAVALTNHCEDKRRQKFIIDKYESQKKFFRKKGEMEYLAFLTCLEMLKYFVEEMWLKEQVYTEIDELEKTPVPKDNK